MRQGCTIVRSRYVRTYAYVRIRGQWIHAYQGLYACGSHVHMHAGARQALGRRVREINGANSLTAEYSRMRHRLGLLKNIVHIYASRCIDIRCVLRTSAVRRKPKSMRPRSSGAFREFEHDVAASRRLSARTLRSSLTCSASASRGIRTHAFMIRSASCCSPTSRIVHVDRRASFLPTYTTTVNMLLQLRQVTSNRCRHDIMTSSRILMLACACMRIVWIGDG